MGRGGTSQNTQRIRPSEAHSQTGDGIGKDKSGHGKNHTERGTLTFWRRHREVQVRTQKESHGARGTHILETASAGASQDTKRIRPSKGHSHPRDGIGRDKSGHGGNPNERGHLLSGDGTSQDAEQIRPSKGRSPTGDGIRGDKSEDRKNQTKEGALTLWRRHRHRGGQVRIGKGSDQVRDTHILETT